MKKAQATQDLSHIEHGRSLSEVLFLLNVEKRAVLCRTENR